MSRGRCCSQVPRLRAGEAEPLVAAGWLLGTSRRPPERLSLGGSQHLQTQIGAFFPFLVFFRLFFIWGWVWGAGLGHFLLSLVLSSLVLGSRG